MSPEATVLQVQGVLVKDKKFPLRPISIRKPQKSKNPFFKKTSHNMNWPANQRRKKVPEEKNPSAIVEYPSQNLPSKRNEKKVHFSARYSNDMTQLILDASSYEALERLFEKVKGLSFTHIPKRMQDTFLTRDEQLEVKTLLGPCPQKLQEFAQWLDESPEDGESKSHSKILTRVLSAKDVLDSAIALLTAVKGKLVECGRTPKRMQDREPLSSVIAQYNTVKVALETAIDESKDGVEERDEDLD
jgi:hypothetical protein